MPVCEEDLTLEELPRHTVLAVRVGEVVDEVAAHDIIDAVVAAAKLDGCPQIHLWATAEHLPLLAAAAATVTHLPEGVQLRQIGATDVDTPNVSTTWMTLEDLSHLVAAHTDLPSAVAA